MNFLEKNLEDIIFETDNEFLKNRGLPVRGKKKRQLKIGNYGIADIIMFHNKLFDQTEPRVGRLTEINILELKREKIDATALIQAARYVRGVRRYLERREFDWEPLIKITLIGRDICHGDFCYLPGFVENLKVYTYEYKVDGIRFYDRTGFFLTEEGFNG